MLLAGSSFAATVYFDNGDTTDALWSRDLNWDLDTVPGSADLVKVWDFAPASSPLLIDNTVAATCASLEINGQSGGTQKGHVKMTGGSLTTTGRLRLGLNGPNAGGVFDIYAGTISVGDDFWVSSFGPGTVNMYSGTVDVADQFGIAVSNGSSTDGRFNLYDGTVTTSRFYRVLGKSVLDIHDGKLIVTGETIIAMNRYIDDNSIIGFNGAGTVTAVEVGNEIHLTATVPEPATMTLLALGGLGFFARRKK
jgi:hypothetical protein